MVIVMVKKLTVRVPQVIPLVLGICIGMILTLVVWIIAMAFRKLDPGPNQKRDNNSVKDQQRQTVQQQKMDMDMDMSLPATSINHPTRGEPSEFQMLGLLTSERSDGVDEPIMLPLLGRQLYNGSQKWEYYAGSDKLHPAKISIDFNNKTCSDDTGCDEIYNGDLVYVPTYNRNFRASIYKKEIIRYIP